MQKKNIISGLWKFRDGISVEKLGEVAEKWAAEDPNYLRLYIRKCSKDQYGIGFEYQVKEGTEKEQNEYFERVSDGLKRQFGNDLVGWDFALPTWFVK